MKKIELKGNIEESLITLNNLRDVEIVESDGSITLKFERHHCDGDGTENDRHSESGSGD